MKLGQAYINRVFVLLVSQGTKTKVVQIYTIISPEIEEKDILIISLRTVGLNHCPPMSLSAYSCKLSNCILTVQETTRETGQLERDSIGVIV